MRIALLLSGQLSHFCYTSNKHPIACRDYWRDITNKYNIDIFCYTDDDNFYYDDFQYFTNKSNLEETQKMQVWRNHKNQKLIDNITAAQIIDNILSSTFANKLKSKIIVDNNILYNNVMDNLNSNHHLFLNYKKSHRTPKNKFDILSQFYKLNQCFRLMEQYEDQQNFKYDIIIRSRFDVSINKLSNQIDLTGLNYNKTIFTNYSPTYKHINDWWAIGDRNIMSQICSYYDNMCPNLLNNIKHILIFKGINVINVQLNDDFTKKTDEHTMDVSDSSEVGLTHIITTNNYIIDYTTLEAQPWRYYD